MRLVDRIGLLIKADAHGAIESIEDRRLLAQQYVREAKLALESKRAQIAGLQIDQRRLAAESKRLSALIGRADQDVELALQRGQADLARSAIRRLLPLQQADRQLTARVAALRDEESRLQERLSIQEQEFELLQTRLQAEMVTAEAGTHSTNDWSRQAVTEDDVELELLRRRDAPAPVGDGAAPKAGR